MVQPVGDDELEDRVAEELEAFVGPAVRVGARRSMPERQLEQFAVVETVSDTCHELLTVRERVCSWVYFSNQVVHDHTVRWILERPRCLRQGVGTFR